MKTEETIAGRIRWAREQAGLSQGQVAKLMGVHRPTISEIESGQRTVRAEEVVFFSDTFEVNADWLLRGDDAVPDNESMRLVARKLNKLSKEDLQTVLKVVRSLGNCERKDG